MLRLVFLLLVAVAGCYLFFRLIKELSQQNVDWRGVGLSTSFVMLAVYLRSVTDIGGLG